MSFDPVINDRNHEKINVPDNIVYTIMASIFSFLLIFRRIITVLINFNTFFQDLIKKLLLLLSCPNG